jgi:hypothetical protein
VQRLVHAREISDLGALVVAFANTPAFEAPLGATVLTEATTRLRRHELPWQDGLGPMSCFRSEKEFREVMDRTFTIMRDDPDMGPQLRDADTPQRFEFTDFDLVVNIRAGGSDEPNLAWEWSDEVAWEPKVRMTMSSETANRYFQGKENVAIAIARRKIKAGGDVKAALAIIPITKPLFAHYRDMIAEHYPHLEV